MQTSTADRTAGELPWSATRAFWWILAAGALAGSLGEAALILGARYALHRFTLFNPQGSWMAPLANALLLVVPLGVVWFLARRRSAGHRDRGDGIRRLTRRGLRAATRGAGPHPSARSLAAGGRRGQPGRAIRQPPPGALRAPDASAHGHDARRLAARRGRVQRRAGLAGATRPCRRRGGRRRGAERDPPRARHGPGALAQRVRLRPGDVAVPRRARGARGALRPRRLHGAVDASLARHVVHRTVSARAVVRLEHAARCGGSHARRAPVGSTDIAPSALPPTCATALTSLG